MTWEDFINSSYFEKLDSELKNIIELGYISFSFFPNETSFNEAIYRGAINDPTDDTDDDSISDENGNKVLPSSEGYYQTGSCTDVE